MCQMVQKRKRSSENHSRRSRTSWQHTRKKTGNFIRITPGFTGPRQTALISRPARPAAPCATHCYPTLSRLLRRSQDSQLLRLTGSLSGNRQSSLIVGKKQPRNASMVVLSETHFSQQNSVDVPWKCVSSRKGELEKVTEILQPSDVSTES